MQTAFMSYNESGRLIQKCERTTHAALIRVRTVCVCIYKITLAFHLHRLLINAEVERVFAISTCHVSFKQILYSILSRSHRYFVQSPGRPL